MVRILQGKKNIYFWQLEKSIASQLATLQFFFLLEKLVYL